MNEVISLVAFFLALFTCFASMPTIMKRMRKAGIVGADAHKRGRPEIPEMGGVGILIGLTAGITVAVLLLPERAWVLLSFLAVVLLAGAVGAYDDLKPLNARVKPVLTALAGLPILLVPNAYDPHMILPIIGRTRLTIVYPLLILPAIAVTANAVNMIDIFNGAMPGTSSVIVTILLISSIFLGRGDATILCMALLGCLLAFYYFNRYPARTFAGDVGSLSVGAAIGAIAIIGQLEVIAVVAFMPQILDAFYKLSSIGRLYEHREVPHPTLVLDDERLVANPDPRAPISLTRMILARGALREQEILRLFIILATVSCALALLTAYIMYPDAMLLLAIVGATTILLGLAFTSGDPTIFRRILDFVYVMLFAWFSMIFGVWLIDALIVPIDFGLPGWWGALLTSMVEVGISALLVLLWLWLWRRLVRVTFWRTLKRNKQVQVT